MTITANGVQFDPGKHSYTRESDGKVLRGITGIIHEYICPRKYDGIPQSVLDAAAARGTAIHNAVEQTALGFWCSTPEAIAFWEDFGAVAWLDSETLITDGEDFASAIDLTSMDEGDATAFWDIKTTSKIDHKYLVWQLSIYAYMWEKMGKGKVGSLNALWWNRWSGWWKRYAYNRIDAEVVADLLRHAASGMPWECPIEETEYTYKPIFEDGRTAKQRGNVKKC